MRSDERVRAEQERLERRVSVGAESDRLRFEESENDSADVGFEDE